MISNADIKAHARNYMIGSYMFLMFVSIVYGFLAFLAQAAADLVSVSPRQNAAGTILNLLLSFVVAVFITILQTGFSFISLNVVRTGRAKLRDLFLGFRYHPGRLVCISLLKGAVRYLCGLPLIWLISEFLLRGTKAEFFGHALTSGWQFALAAAVCILFSLILYIAVDLLFSQALYLFIDHQEMGVLPCLKESCRLMKKNRMRLFLLRFSFIGYWFLVILSLGIALICVKPYMDLSDASFYVELSGQRDPYGAM